MQAITKTDYERVIDDLDLLRGTVDRHRKRTKDPENPPAETSQTRSDDRDGTRAIFRLKKTLEGMTTDNDITPGFKMILRKR